MTGLGDRRVQSGASNCVLLPEGTSNSSVEMSVIVVSPFCDPSYPTIFFCSDGN